ncbi:MAG: hypothetical protein KDC95_20460, partial [Planctomycetes bacterium]|nr:hypothetical protein [Planctomycetota bacterium]
MAQSYDYAAAAAYSDRIGGEALVASVDGAIAYEHYSRGFTATQGHILNSATKSITGLLCAFAVQDNLLA